jgi:hypothetical protein
LKRRRVDFKRRRRLRRFHTFPASCPAQRLSADSPALSRASAVSDGSISVPRRAHIPLPSVALSPVVRIPVPPRCQLLCPRRRLRRFHKRPVSRPAQRLSADSPALSRATPSPTVL